MPPPQKWPSAFICTHLHTRTTLDSTFSTRSQERRATLRVHLCFRTEDSCWELEIHQRRRIQPCMIIQLCQTSELRFLLRFRDRVVTIECMCTGAKFVLFSLSAHLNNVVIRITSGLYILRTFTDGVKMLQYFERFSSIVSLKFTWLEAPPEVGKNRSLGWAREDGLRMQRHPCRRRITQTGDRRSYLQSICHLLVKVIAVS